MSKFGKFALIASLFAFAFLAIGASGRIGLTKISGKGTNYNTKAYDTSQVDTVRWYRDEGVQTLSFGMHWTDSVNINQVFVLRVINGTPTARVAGDTLTAFTAFVTVAESSAQTSITLAPLADEYWFIVQYSDTLLLPGTVKYEVTKGY